MQIELISIEVGWEYGFNMFPFIDWQGMHAVVGLLAVSTQLVLPVTRDVADVDDHFYSQPASFLLARFSQFCLLFLLPSFRCV